MITDLTSTDSSAFISESSSWVLSNAVCPSCSQTFTIPPNSCGLAQEIVFGGPNILGPSGQPTNGETYERLYEKMDTFAYKIGVEFDFWVFTSSAIPSALMKVQVNNDAWLSGTFVSEAPECSVDYQVSTGVFVKYIYKYHAYGWFDVSNLIIFGSSFKLQIQSQSSYPSTTYSVGIKNVKIYRTSPGSLTPANFPCDKNEYWDGNSCASCSSFCEVCSDSSNTQCTVCRDGYYNYNDGTCRASCDPPYTDQTISGKLFCVPACPTDFYWAHNKSCSTTCDSPFTPSVSPGTSLKACISLCGTSQFLYPNQTCLSTCLLPLQTTITTTYKLCTNPCLNTGLYLFPSGSCLADCPDPLKIRSIPTIDYCYSPCSSSQPYLYTNGSCDALCLDPLVAIDESTTTGIKYCRNPCQNTDDFLYPNRSCMSDCPLPLLTRVVPGTNFCYNPCSDSTPYLYPNSSCQADCQPPLVVQSEDDVQYCRNPCQPSEYLYLNRSCKAACPQPLHIRSTPGADYCYSPCDLSTEYLFEDGTCIASCDSPLITQDDPEVRYCRNPCYNTNNYLYPNSTCKSTCNFPLDNRTDTLGLYCFNPCLVIPNSFLHHNQSCLETCQSPLVMKNEPIADFCLLPCEDPEQYFFEPTAKCQGTCDYPYIAITDWVQKLCISSLDKEEIKQIEKIADATSTAGTAADTGVAVLSLITSSDSTSACMGPIAKMLQYIQFMNISFPEKVQLMMDQQNENARSEGFTQKMLGETLDEFPNHELPKKFQVYRMPSSFFVNFWPTLFNLLVILLVTFAVMILASQTKGSPRINGVLQNVTEALKWNVTLIMFCGCLGDVVFFTALELQAMQFDNFAAVFSFILCLLVNFLAIFVVVKILEINSILRKSKKSNITETQKIEKQWCNYKALFECYRDGSYSQQIFLFVFIMRSALFNGMIGYLYQYPLFQAVIFTLSNIIMLLYLLIKRPMRKLVNLLQQIVLELALLPFNTCVLILAIMDRQAVKAFDQRESLGNVILYINIAVPFLALALMAAKVVAIGLEFYKQKKANQLNKLKKFNVEISRQTNVPLNTTQGILPSQTLSSSSFLVRSAVPVEHMQVLDLAESVYLPRSPDTSFNFLNPSFSPALHKISKG